MSSKVTNKHVFSLRVMHAYYREKAPPLAIEPNETTLRTLDALNLGWRSDAGELHFYRDLDGDAGSTGAPNENRLPSAWLVFFVRALEVEVSACTACESGSMLAFLSTSEGGLVETTIPVASNDTGDIALIDLPVGPLLSALSGASSGILNSNVSVEIPAPRGWLRYHIATRESALLEVVDPSGEVLFNRLEYDDQNGAAVFESVSPVVLGDTVQRSFELRRSGAQGPETLCQLPNGSAAGFSNLPGTHDVLSEIHVTV